MSELLHQESLLFSHMKNKMHETIMGGGGADSLALSLTLSGFGDRGFVIGRNIHF